MAAHARGLLQDDLEAHIHPSATRPTSFLPPQAHLPRKSEKDVTNLVFMTTVPRQTPLHPAQRVAQGDRHAAWVRCLFERGAG